MTQTDKWWETRCPICGEAETVEPVMQVHEDTVLRCSDCEFEWNTKLSEWALIALARDHIRREKKS